MKRLCSSDSLSALKSTCPNSTDGEDQVNNTIYTREFHTMVDGLDEEVCADEHSGHVSEKKRRLSVGQVRALEKNFEVDNKLEPERKLELAHELNLQPRQVAVWFQNRRARWKTKQLERDYGVLKASYDGLKLGYEKLQRGNEALLKEIKELKSKLNEDGSCGEEEDEHTMSDKTSGETQVNNVLDPKSEEGDEEPAADMKTENFGEDHRSFLCGSALVYDLKDGSCDSDSSAILNEDADHNNNNSPKSNAAAISSYRHHHHHHHHHHQQFLDIHSGTNSTSMNINFQFSSSSHSQTSIDGDSKVKAYDCYDYRIDEHNFFGHDHEEEESCTNLFSDDQAPSLPWYCSHEWN